MDFPEPLFEAHLQETKLCLACARKRAVSVLRTTGREIVPICADCSAAWNVHGYQILKRIKPGPLIWRIAVFKARHPFQKPSLRSIWNDIGRLKAWAGKMKRWM